MKKIKKIFTKRQLFLIMTYLGVMSALQLASNFVFERNIYVIAGMIGPIFLSEPVKRMFGKYKNAYLFYINTMIRIGFMTISWGILHNFSEGSIIVDGYFVVFAGLIVSFAFAMGINITYSLSGIVAINSVAAFLMNDAYPQFAVGFLAFFVFELIRGAKFTFVIFSKSELQLNFSALDKRKQLALTMMFLVAGTLLLLNIPGSTEIYAISL